MLTLKGHKSRIRGIAFSPDGAWLASAGGAGHNVSLWKLATQQRIYLGGFTAKVLQLGFSPTGDLFVARDLARDVRTWKPDPHATDKQHMARWATGEVFAFGPGGLFVGNLKTLTLPDGSTRSYLDKQKQGLETFELACAPDGGWLAVAGQQKGYFGAVLNLRETKPARDFKLASQPNALTVTPDSTCAVVAVGTGIEFWDVTEIRRVTTLKGHGRVVMGLNYLPDGRLLSCSTDGTVKTWADGKCVDTRDWGIGPLHALTVAPDGMRAAAGSEDGTIFIWDLD